MSGVEGNSQTQKAVATHRGWENPVTGEVIVAIRGLSTKSGEGDVFRASWGVTPVGGGIARLYVDFNEKVDVTEGASLVVYSNLKAYATLTASTTGALAASDAVVLGTGANARTYSFTTTPTNANEVKLESTVLASFTALHKAINLSGIEGTDYGVSTTVHATIESAGTAAVSSTGSVTVAANGTFPANGSTVAIGSTTYTFNSSTATLSAGKVFYGGSATQALSNLLGAITARDGLNPSSSIYLVEAAHATVTAVATSVTAMTLTAKTAGVEGNVILNTSSATMLVSGARLLGGISKLRVQAKNGGSNTSACTDSITNAAIAFSTTQVVLGSTTQITLKFGAHSVTQNLSRVIFDKLTDGSTTATWSAQGQVVSLTTGVITGTIVDASTTTVSVTTVTASVVAALGNTHAPYTTV